ncbi:hypothetical protein [Microbacterium sp.]|uniref:hypothetical protein n=1 Tax=Microbacterium sp. TaxID=51671 RepID=UPI003A86ABC4
MAAFWRRREEPDAAPSAATERSAAPVAEEGDELSRLREVFGPIMHEDDTDQQAKRVAGHVAFATGTDDTMMRFADDDAPTVPPPLAASLTRQTGADVSSLDQAIHDLLSIDGALGAAVVDVNSGMALAAGGEPGFDLSIAAAGNSNVVRAKLQTMNEIGLAGQIDDMLITLDSQYHLINVLKDESLSGIFVYLVMDKAKANLALARHKLTAISRGIAI